MDFIVVGGGAVGAVVGTLLEHAGHAVTYWARPGQARSSEPFEIERDGSRAIRSQPVRWLGADTSPPPRSDWVIVCVRTEQLAAALADVVQSLGAERAVAIATVTLDGALSAARAAGLSGPVLALHVAFGSGLVAGDPRRLAWFPFTVPSTVSAEGQPQLRAAARQVARLLAAGGLPARSALDLGGMMRLLVVANTALLPAWALCAWDIARLARSRDLRPATAGAMCEALRCFAPERGLARVIALSLPRSAFAVLLRVLPWLMGRRARKLWLVHGPKLTEQTRYALRELLTRAEGMGRPVPHLASLAARWESALPSGEARG